MIFGKLALGGEARMTGRNNHPKNDGPAAKPSRLDQFGEKMADNEPSKQGSKNVSGKR